MIDAFYMSMYTFADQFSIALAIQNTDYSVKHLQVKGPIAYQKKIHPELSPPFVMSLQNLKSFNFVR